MRKSKFSPEQIAKTVKEFDDGKSLAEYVMHTESAQHVFTNGEASMSSKKLRRLKSLEEENRSLKLMYTNISLDYHMAEEIIE